MKNPALFELYSLFEVELAEKIYKEVSRVLAVNPYKLSLFNESIITVETLKIKSILRIALRILKL